MKAITLYRPWSYAVAHLGKDIENRSWKCPLPIGSNLAIHSGQKWDKQGAEWIKNTLGLQLPKEEEIQPGQIICVITFGGNLTESESKWFFGPYGWALEDAFVLPEPVPCKGAQGLWSIPAHELSLVTRQL